MLKHNTVYSILIAHRNLPATIKVLVVRRDLVDNYTSPTSEYISLKQNGYKILCTFILLRLARFDTGCTKYKLKELKNNNKSLVLPVS